MKKFWHKIDDELPPKNIKRGVFIKWTNPPECGHDFSVSNVDYIRIHPEQITHWARIPFIWR